VRGVGAAYTMPSDGVTNRADAGRPRDTGRRNCTIQDRQLHHSLLIPTKRPFVHRPMPAVCNGNYERRTDTSSFDVHRPGAASSSVRRESISVVVLTTPSMHELLMNFSNQFIYAYNVQINVSGLLDFRPHRWVQLMVGG